MKAQDVTLSLSQCKGHFGMFPQQQTLCQDIIKAATPDVPNQTPMPHLSKEMLNVCPMPPMHMIVQLLPGCQSSILCSNEWHNNMNVVFISAVMAPNLKTKEITAGTRRFIPIPNQDIHRCPGVRGQIRTMLPNISTATATLGTCEAYLGFHKSVLHMPPMELMGMGSVKCVIKNGKWGQWLKGFNPSALSGSPWWGDINMVTSPLPSPAFPRAVEPT